MSVCVCVCECVCERESWSVRWTMTLDPLQLTSVLISLQHPPKVIRYKHRQQNNQHWCIMSVIKKKSDKGFYFSMMSRHCWYFIFCIWWLSSYYTEWTQIGEIQSLWWLTDTQSFYPHVFYYFSLSLVLLPHTEVNTLSWLLLSILSPRHSLTGESALFLEHYVRDNLAKATWATHASKQAHELMLR